MSVARGGQSRRTVGRTLLGIVGAGAASVLAVRAAVAYRGWCRSDPLISLDGDLADIFADSPFKILLEATGPTEYVVTVPHRVDTDLILAGPGFGHGERLRFRTSRRFKKVRQGIEIRIKMRVPAKADLPVRLAFAPRVVGVLNPETALGRTNEWVTLETVF